MRGTVEAGAAVVVVVASLTVVGVVAGALLDVLSVVEVTRVVCELLLDDVGVPEIDVDDVGVVVVELMSNVFDDDSRVDGA